MQLSELINSDRLNGDAAPSPATSMDVDDVEILGVTSDSREVRPGYLFAALPGFEFDGVNFIEQAISRGAVAIVLKDTLSDQYLNSEAVLINTCNPHREFARLTARFFGKQPEYVVAVTGTNGKTSVAEYTRQFWRLIGYKSASLGTLGLVDSRSTKILGLTTLDPVKLHKILRELEKNKIDRVALEASSHGLEQFRLDGVKIRAAAFTNLTRDHLDYHRDMEAYFNAKTRLFSEVLMEEGVAVLNADIKEFKKLRDICTEKKIKILTFGRAKCADIRLLNLQPNLTQQEIEFEIMGIHYKSKLSLMGEFQVMNVLAALGLIMATQSDDVDLCIEALEKLTGVVGRLEHVATHANGAPVIVDYAHTPDALKNSLKALREHVKGKLICVFGAGGGRDKDKRQLMGCVAEEFADLSVVTDDNPRNEHPDKIREQILIGCPSAINIGGRGDAIQFAISELRSDDLLLIAGKGHETEQLIGDRRIKFSDAAFVKTILSKFSGSQI